MTKSKTTNRIFGDGIPDTFVKLCMVHVPRPIHDKAEYGNAMEIIQALLWGKVSRKVFDLEMSGGYARMHEPGS